MVRYAKEWPTGQWYQRYAHGRSPARRQRYVFRSHCFHPLKFVSLAGRSAILSGSLFGGALCVFLQYAFNEANITRLRFISERQATNGNAVVREPSVRSKYQTSESTHPEPGPWASLLQLVGLKSISDEEFLERLKRRREVFQGRIAELEKQAEEERVMKELAQELQTERENSS